MKLITIGLLGLFTAACGDNATVQTITGRVAHESFGANVETVAVVHNGRIVSQAPVATDGTFAVQVRSGSGYALHFRTAANAVALISPRPTGTMDTTFAVRSPGAAFDLGVVREITQPLTVAYHYSGTPGGSDADVECENGLDPSGAVCVDDDAQDGQVCDAGDGDGETNDDVSDGDGETNDDGDGDGETDDDAMDVAQAAAVAEHNVPSQIGCDDGDGETNDDGADEAD